MMNYNLNYNEDTGYVNIHGNNIKVFVCEKTGRILVPIEEVKNMGFQLYHKSQYSRFHIDDKQFSREFDLYMLQAAQNYILEKNLAFRENEIFESINKCKQILSSRQGGVTSASTRNNFKLHTSLHGQVRSEAPDDIKITAQMRQPSGHKKSENHSRWLGNVRNSKKGKKFSSDSSECDDTPLAKDERSGGFNNVSRLGNKTPEHKQKRVTTRLPQIELNKTEHRVVVTHIEKTNCVWVQDVDSADIILGIDKMVRRDATKPSTSINYIHNKMYLAQQEGSWYRCTMIHFQPLTVFFVDYGNIAAVSELKHASEELAQIPCQAVKIAFTGFEPKVGQCFKIRIREKCLNGVHVVDILPEYDVALPKLEDGQRVIVIAQKEGRLALRTKECYDKLKQIEKSLGGFQAVTVPRAVKGQVVLCEQEGKLKRAAVSGIEGNRVALTLLDYWENVTVNVTSLKDISQSLVAESVTYITTPKVKGFHPDAAKIIEELICNKTKASVVLSTDGEFDLKLGDELLSSKLITDRPMLAQLTWYKPEFGLGEYMLNSYESTKNLTFADCETFQKHIDALIVTKLEDTEPYEPIVGEVCFGYYQDSWARCVILKRDKLRYKVNFIDFGNIEILTPEHLRKLTTGVRDVPVVGIPCKLTGIPVVREYEELAKKNLIEGETYEINIKEFVEDVYTIEIPSISSVLRSD